MSEQAEYIYDVFISYSHADRAWVWDELLPQLEGAGLRVCIDDRDFEPGVPSLVNMENAVERSRKTLIVLTPAWVESEWTTFESLLIQTDDPAGRRARMIPSRLKPCKPPKRIAMLTYVDLTQPSEVEFQLQRLVAVIRGEPMPDGPRSAPERAQDGWLFEVVEASELEDTKPKQRVRIYLQGDFPSLSADRRSAAIDAFAALMGIPPQAIEVYSVYEGSIVFDLGIPSNAVQRLHSLLQSNSGQLRLLKVEKVILEGEAGEIEEWVIKEGRFDLVTPIRPTTPTAIDFDERTALEQELTIHRRNLRKLRLQKATYAAGEEPLHLLNKIEQEEREIGSIEVKLRHLNEAIEAEAQKQRQLARLYSQGMACFGGGDWAQAIHLLQQILHIDKDYKDVSQILTQARKQERLEQLYARAKQAEANQDWQQIVTVCQQIIGIAPFYRDVQRLVRKARFHSARQRAGAIWARYKTAIGMLAILLLIVAGIPVLGKQIVSMWKPTPMPSTSQISVEAFLIKKGETPTATVKPGTMIIATVQEIVQIKVEVSTTYEEQGKDLVFTWYTCRKGKNPVLERIGNPEMLYVAPIEPGLDCICVAVEKGGVQLDKDEIFVDVQK